MRYAVELGGERFSMESTQGLFSPERADAGTLAVLSVVTLEPEQRVLDLGCGCGLVGIYAARRCGAHNVWMTDIDSKAVEYARRNAQANGAEGVHISCGDAFEAVEASEFDWILTNPPYQSDFSVAKRFIEKGFNRLRLGGHMVMVTKRRDWYRNKLVSIFGGVRIEEIDGYFVFIAQKRGQRYANASVRAAGRKRR